MAYSPLRELERSAIELFQKAGYAVTVRTPKLTGLAGSSIVVSADSAYVEISLGQTGYIDDSHSLKEYIGFENPNLTLEVRLPEFAGESAVMTGGIFHLYPDGRVEVDKATGEAIKVLLGSKKYGYRLHGMKLIPKDEQKIKK